MRIRHKNEISNNKVFKGGRNGELCNKLRIARLKSVGRFQNCFIFLIMFKSC